jgi:hypothetical protein
MIRVLPSLAAAAIILTLPAAADSALDFWRTNAPGHAASRAKEPLDIRPEKQRRADPYVVALVDKAAHDFGVRKELADFTVKRESGWNVAAANRASTARGLFQVIRGTHADIIGRPLSYAEHRALSFDAKHHVNVGMAHLRMCQDAMPGASAARIWKQCHHDGPAAAGTRMEAARAHYARVVEGRAFPFMVSAYAPPQGTFGVAMLPAAFVPGNEGKAR